MCKVQPSHRRPRSAPPIAATLTTERQTSAPHKQPVQELSLTCAKCTHNETTTNPPSHHHGALDSTGRQNPPPRNPSKIISWLFCNLPKTRHTPKLQNETSIAATCIVAPGSTSPSRTRLWNKLVALVLLLKTSQIKHNAHSIPRGGATQGPKRPYDNHPSPNLVQLRTKIQNVEF